MPAALHDAEKRLFLVRFKILSVRLQRALGPSMSSFHRLALILVGLGRRGALVEGEEDVRPERVLYLDRTFGSEAMERTVEVGGKGNTLVVNDGELAVLACDAFIKYGDCFFLRSFVFHEFRNSFAERGAEREDLKAARVGHGRPLPAHEISKTARLCHYLFARL